jgi:hypothetical protein
VATCRGYGAGGINDRGQIVLSEPGNRLAAVAT